MSKFDAKNDEIADLSKKLGGWIEEDYRGIELSKDLREAMQRLSTLRTTMLSGETFEQLQTNALITIQAEIIGRKYYIARELSLLMGAQSYAFVYRKYQAASQYSPVKERLAEGREKAPTVSEIDAEIEQSILGVRKTEIAYQVVCDRIKVLIDWADDAIRLIQNKLREQDADRRASYAQDNHK